VQIGAAIGREFSHALVASVARKPEAELASALNRVVEAGLLFRQGVPPHASYLFKHALVQDAAYGTKPWKYWVFLGFSLQPRTLSPTWVRRYGGMRRRRTTAVSGRIDVRLMDGKVTLRDLLTPLKHTRSPRAPRIRLWTSADDVRVSRGFPWRCAAACRRLHDQGVARQSG